MNMRDKRLNEFAIRTGIRPAFGERFKILLRLSEDAVDLIRVIELERSGIRDGDGFWSGCDPLESIIRSISDHYDHLQHVDKAANRGNAA